jgi:hypothetical protein
VAFFFVDKGLYVRCGLSKSSCNQNRWGYYWGYSYKIELTKNMVGGISGKLTDKGIKSFINRSAPGSKLADGRGLYLQRKTPPNWVAFFFKKLTTNSLLYLVST